MDGDNALRTYLWLVGGRGSGEGYFELRHRTANGMRSEFRPCDDMERLSQRVAHLGDRTDAYLGVALRREPRGTADAVAASWLAWVDCDSPASTARLASLQTPPSFTIASGSPGHVHAYWLLQRPLNAAGIRTLNLQLADATGGDRRCCDPARILRPPGTHNYKRHPATPVHMLDAPSAVAIDPTALAATLPTPSARLPVARSLTPARSHATDPLRGVSAREYVPALSGRPVGRDGKAACPFHDDHTPSLHAYADPDRGWYCYGCGKGGSIYEFAAELWQTGTRGRDFVELRQRLLDTVGPPFCPRRS